MELLRPPEEPARAVEALGAWLAEERARHLLIETSGSTGRPKRVVLSRDAVVASAQASARRLGGTGRWALVLPASYVAGVQVIVRSLLAGHAPVLGDWGDPAGPAGPATYTSVVPTQLYRVLEGSGRVQARALDALRGMEAVLVGGGPVDAPLRERAEAEGIRVVATYGASETAGGCVYDGVPLDGVGVALDADGRIRLAGPTLFEEYLDDPGLTSRSLVDGWFVTSDAGRLDEDGRLQVLGRIDDVVVSGGVKIPLPAVRRRLLEHPDVRHAEVVGVPDPEWGHRVVAVLVTDEEPGGLALDVARLRDWVNDRHPRSWAPSRLVRVEALPLLDNGKVDRAAVQALAEEAR